MAIREARQLEALVAEVLGREVTTEQDREGG